MGREVMKIGRKNIQESIPDLQGDKSVRPEAVIEPG